MADKNSYTSRDREVLLRSVFKSTPDTRGENIGKDGRLRRFFEMIRGPKKYRYLGVCFWEDDDVYYYRTEDRSIRVGKVVMVPVEYGPDRPAEVVSARWYSEGYAPQPLKWTPMISGPAGFRDQIKFDWARRRRKARERREERRSGCMGCLLGWIFIDIFFDD